MNEVYGLYTGAMIIKRECYPFYKRSADFVIFHLAQQKAGIIEGQVNVNLERFVKIQTEQDYAKVAQTRNTSAKDPQRPVIDKEALRIELLCHSPLGADKKTLKLMIDEYIAKLQSDVTRVLGEGVVKTQQKPYIKTIEQGVTVSGEMQNAANKRLQKIKQASTGAAKAKEEAAAVAEAMEEDNAEKVGAKPSMIKKMTGKVLKPNEMPF